MYKIYYGRLWWVKEREARVGRESCQLMQIWHLLREEERGGRVSDSNAESEKVSARLMGSPGAKKTQWSSSTIGRNASALVIPLCSARARSIPATAWSPWKCFGGPHRYSNWTCKLTTDSLLKGDLRGTSAWLSYKDFCLYIIYLYWALPINMYQPIKKSREKIFKKQSNINPQHFPTIFKIRIVRNLDTNNWV